MEPVLRRFDARDYLRVLTKRKWFVIMVALAAMVIGGLYQVSYPKTYKAAAMIMIQRQGQPIIWVGDPNLQGPQREDLALETQARIAASIDCADAAARSLASRTAGDAIQTTGQEIAASINATPSQPDLLRIEAVHRDQRYAIEFANEVARAFVDKSLELRQTESRAARDFLDEALRTSRRELDAAQAEAALYQEQVGIVVPEQEPGGAVEQLRGYQNQLADARTSLQGAEADLAVVRGEVAHTPSYRTTRHEAPNPDRQSALQDLEAARLDLNRLKARYTDNWPAVQDAKDRVEAAEARLARLPETITTTSVEAEGELASLRHELILAERKVREQRARVAALTATVNQLQAQKQTMPRKLAQLHRLLDRAELAKISYRNVQAQLENARLNAAMKQPDAEVIDHAAAAAEITPMLGRTLIFALMLGLAAGVALALFLEALDDTLHSPEDIAAYTEATFLGMVPMLEDPTQGLVTVFSPKSPPAEAYRTLRSNIHFAQVDHPARTFLVTSAGAGEGKTLTTANLAVVFAQAGQEVLLIDTDLRRPSLHRIFNVSSEHGLTNVLVGETDLSDVVYETEVPGLHIVPTGPLPPNPAELLESEQMTRVIERARDLADVVLFDSPPAIVLTDAVIMSSKVERTILVAEAGQVTRDAFNEMCRLITNARGTILGVVLNKLRLSAADYYYYYYYYDYSHYSPQRSDAPMALTPQATPQAGFTHPDAPTVLEEIFGPEEPLTPQTQQPPLVRPRPAPLRPEPTFPVDQPPTVAQPPRISPPPEPPPMPEPEEAEPARPQPDQPPQDPTTPQDDQPGGSSYTPRSPIEDLFGSDGGNQE